MTLSTYLLTIFNFLKVKKINDLGIKNILKLLLEYLTRLSVKIDISKTSKNLENEYKKGIKT